jgi:hypothetical protein
MNGLLKSLFSSLESADSDPVTGARLFTSQVCSSDTDRVATL